MEVERKDNKVHFNYFDRAYAVISINEEKNHISIDVLNVDPIYRGMGIASTVVDEILKYIRSFFSKYKEVTLSPLPLEESGIQLSHLINFYKKFGFILVQSEDESKPYLMSISL